MSNSELAVFSYLIAALISFMILCNTFAAGKSGSERTRITPIGALFLGIIWPIGLLAAYIAFVRNK